jgi:hypothetical protein
MSFNIKDPHVAKYNREGVVTLPANTVIPAGKYFAITFLASGAVTVDFEDTEAPLWTGTRTVTFPAGYTLYTDLQIPAACAARISSAIVLHVYR